MCSIYLFPLTFSFFPLVKAEQSKRTIKYPIIYLYWGIFCCLKISGFLKQRVWAAGGPLTGDICSIRQWNHHKRRNTSTSLPTWLQGRCDTRGCGSHQTWGWPEKLQRWGSSCGHRDSLRWPRGLPPAWSPASSRSPDTLPPPSAPQSQGSHPDCLDCEDCHPESRSCSQGDQREPLSRLKGIYVTLWGKKMCDITSKFVGIRDILQIM